MKYVSSLDGLRSVAILAVLGFHAFPKTLYGGFTGVDVFFVLSGYLITSVILYDIRDGDFTFREFYLRRVQRLLPNAVVMLLVTVGIYFFLLLPSLAVSVAKHGIWVMFNLSNMYIWRNAGGYWGDSASSLPLLHTWSLAVEEQFYLLFPLTLSLLSRRRNLFLITAGLSLGSLALSIYGTGAYPTATFYLLPTRAWQPLFGAALATFMVPSQSAKPVRTFRRTLSLEIAGWVGLVMIVAGFFFIRESGGHYPGVIALLPAGGSVALLAAIANGNTSSAWLLSRAFFVWVGKLSYSLYLWHWPMIVIGRTVAELLGRSRRAGELIGLSVGVALAILAYYFVEAPLRKRGPGRHRRLMVLATGFAVCALFCFTLSRHRPIADPLGRFDRLSFYGLLYNVNGDDNFRAEATIRYYDVQVPAPPREPEIWMKGGIVHNWGGGTPRIVVIGSSHALMYGRLIDDICKEQKISVAFLSADSTPVLFPTKVAERFPTAALAASFDAARKRWINDWNPDAIIVIDRWDYYVTEPVAEFNQQLRDLAADLAPHTRNVIFFSQVPVLRFGQTINLREYVNWYENYFGHLPSITPDAQEAFRRGANATLQELSRDNAKIQLLRVDTPFYLPDGSIHYSEGRNFLYADDNHLSDAGTEVLRSIVTDAIVAPHPMFSVRGGSGQR